MDKKGFSSLSQVMGRYKPSDKKKPRYVSREWQDYGYRLALELDDVKHTSLYMRLCKLTPRYVLEEARTFVKGASNVKSKARLFMWKVGQIKKEKKRKEND